MATHPSPLSSAAKAPAAAPALDLYAAPYRLRHPCGFTPTPAQIRFFNAVEVSNLNFNLAELCEKANVSLSSYYQWCRQPGFRVWMVRQFSQVLLFDGWQALHQARTRMDDSVPHFLTMCRLLFDSRGLAALDQWAERVAGLDGKPERAAALPAPPTPAPGRVAGYLRRLVAGVPSRPSRRVAPPQAAAQPAPHTFQSETQPAQSLEPEICKNPAPPSEPAPAPPADPVPLPVVASAPAPPPASRVPQPAEPPRAPSSPRGFGGFTLDEEPPQQRYFSSYFWRRRY